MSFGQNGILSFILIVIFRVSSSYHLIKMFQNNTLKIVRESFSTDKKASDFSSVYSRMICS